MKFLTALVLAIGLSTAALANGGGGIPTVPPVPEQCLTADRVMQIAEGRSDEIVVNTTEIGTIAPFSTIFNETKPKTAYKFERLMIIQAANPLVSTVVILLFYAEGPAQSCGTAFTMPKQVAARIYAEARGLEH